MSRPEIARTVLSFQLATGGRVALRTLVPGAAAVMAASVLYGDPGVIFAVVNAVLFPAAPSIGAAVLAATFAVGLAAACGPRLCSGINGWMRHLPISGRVHRRAATAAVSAACSPATAIVLVSGLLGVAAHPESTLPRLAGLPLLAWGAAHVALPLSRKSSRIVAAIAVVACWVGTWPLLVSSLVLLIVAEVFAGPLVASSQRPVRVRQRRDDSERGPDGAALVLWFSVARRALGARLVMCWLAASVGVLPAMFFIHNNQLTPTHETLAARLAGLVSVLLVMAAVADTLVKRRPPWPWIRSLPWSSRTRVALDSWLLGLTALPVLLVVAWMGPRAVLPLLASLPVLSIRGAAAIRRAPGRISGASGQLLLEGLLPSLLVTLLPWFSLVLLAAVPTALRLASAEERRQDVSRWHELHHLAAGDSLSWSDT